MSTPTIIGSIGTTISTTATVTTTTVQSAGSLLVNGIGIADDLTLSGRIHSKAYLRATAIEASNNTDSDPRSTEEILAHLGL